MKRFINSATNPASEPSEESGRGSPLPRLVGLLHEFVEMSEPSECGCEFQHVEWCNTMKWKKKLEELEGVAATADRITDAVGNLRDVKGRHNTATAYKRLMDLLPNVEPSHP